MAEFHRQLLQRAAASIHPVMDTELLDAQRGLCLLFTTFFSPSLWGPFTAPGSIDW